MAREERWIFTARSRKDETRNGRQNGNRNGNRNQETIVLGLFSNFQIKRDLEREFPDSDFHSDFHSDEHFEFHLFENGLCIQTKIHAHKNNPC